MKSLRRRAQNYLCVQHAAHQPCNVNLNSIAFSRSTYHVAWALAGGARKFVACHALCLVAGRTTQQSDHAALAKMCALAVACLLVLCPQLAHSLKRLVCPTHLRQRQSTAARLGLCRRVRRAAEPCYGRPEHAARSTYRRACPPRWLTRETVSIKPIQLHVGQAVGTAPIQMHVGRAVGTASTHVSHDVLDNPGSVVQVRVGKTSAAQRSPDVAPQN